MRSTSSTSKLQQLDRMKGDILEVIQEGVAELPKLAECDAVIIAAEDGRIEQCVVELRTITRTLHNAHYLQRRLVKAFVIACEILERIGDDFLKWKHGMLLASEM